MKIKVLRSKISKKRFQSFSFPRFTRKEYEELNNDAEQASITKASITRAPVKYSESAVIGYFSIKNFREITARMQSDPEKLGKYLNKLVSTYNEIVLSDKGNVCKFSGTGALFAFLTGQNARDAVIKTIVAALKMRYVLNKFNREWEHYRGSAWQVGFGIDVGQVNIEEHHDSKPDVNISGRSDKIARGIARSAGSSQILLTESMYLQFPFLETSFEINPPRHVPVTGEKFLSKMREVVGMVGSQAKKIYEVYV